MANAGILYDKYTVIQKLQERGFSHEQAEGIAEVLTDSDTSGLTTKGDLKAAVADLRSEMRDLKVSLIQWMIGIQLGYGALILAAVALFT